jgi:hypothetical protein
MDPRAGLDTEVRGKIPCLCRGSNLGYTILLTHNCLYNPLLQRNSFTFFILLKLILVYNKLIDIMSIYFYDFREVNFLFILFTDRFPSVYLYGIIYMVKFFTCNC